MTAEANLPPDGSVPEPPAAEPELTPAAAPEPEAVYDSAEAALVADRLEALGYIE